MEIGAIAALANVLGGLGPYPAAIAVCALGAVSGYVTGGGISGNALFMPSAAATGAELGASPLFAALQNSAAGHVAMASLPVAALLLAAVPTRDRSDDRTAMKTGLALGGLYALILELGGTPQLASARLQ